MNFADLCALVDAEVPASMFTSIKVERNRFASGTSYQWTIYSEKTSHADPGATAEIALANFRAALAGQETLQDIGAKKQQVDPIEKTNARDPVTGADVGTAANADNVAVEEKPF